ncbi:hypothetical protein FFWV33_05640 [Flavobacterium faecale]|uniref:Uncharacterized protein n=1 Tax=Flavobacterium faecale TaxID=1355330 RepID=A0A2S1LBE4_9FLAO|nr:hypothetical protein FFWV33_05640 [Flavobacterium faecale]
MTKQKALNSFHFFKSTLVFNFAISLVSLLIFGLNAFFITFLFFGFFTTILIKETNYKNEYIFYLNNQITKLELWLYCWVFYLLLVLILKSVIHIITVLF